MGEKEYTAPVSVPRRLKGWQIVALGGMALLIVAAGFLYSRRTTITSILFGTHMPSGIASVTSLKLPPGFQANVFYQGLKGPRFITFSPNGTLFVAESSTGNIVALPDPQQTGIASEPKVVISGLNDPTSLYFYQNMLYVGEADKVTRFTIN